MVNKRGQNTMEEIIERLRYLQGGLDNATRDEIKLVAHDVSVELDEIIDKLKQINVRSVH